MLILYHFDLEKLEIIIKDLLIAHANKNCDCHIVRVSLLAGPYADYDSADHIYVEFRDSTGGSNQAIKIFVDIPNYSAMWIPDTSRKEALEELSNLSRGYFKSITSSSFPKRRGKYLEIECDAKLKKDLSEAMIFVRPQENEDLVKINHKLFKKWADDQDKEYHL